MRKIQPVSKEKSMIDPNDQLITQRTPNPYLTSPMYLQSPPTAALGGANQAKRNWCSGRFDLSLLGETKEITLDNSFGEWVTVQWHNISSLEVSLVEDNVFRMSGPGRVVQFRRNGDKITITNHTATARLFIVHVTDYESRPVTSV